MPLSLFPATLIWLSVMISYCIESLLLAGRGRYLVMLGEGGWMDVAVDHLADIIFKLSIFDTTIAHH